MTAPIDRPQGAAHMPEAVTHGHGVRSEADNIHTGKLVFVGVASLVVFVIASVLTVNNYYRRVEAHGPVPVPPEIGQSKIGIVEQQVFDVAVRGARDRAARLERLRSYGWVDRDAKLVHLPIDRAMELVAQGTRPVPDSVPVPARPGAQP